MLIMLSIWTGIDKNQFFKSLFWVNQHSDPWIPRSIKTGRQMFNSFGHPVWPYIARCWHTLIHTSTYVVIYWYMPFIHQYISSTHCHISKHTLPSPRCTLPHVDARYQYTDVQHHHIATFWHKLFKCWLTDVYTWYSDFIYSMYIIHTLVHISTHYCHIDVGLMVEYYIITKSKVISLWISAWTLCTHADFIVLPHWEMRLPALCPNIPFSHVILTLIQPVLALS